MVRLSRMPFREGPAMHGRRRIGRITGRHFTRPRKSQRLTHIEARRMFPSGRYVSNELAPGRQAWLPSFCPRGSMEVGDVERRR